MEFLERMYHEETMHVNNGRVNTKLIYFELSGEVADEKSGLLPLVHLLLDGETISSRWRVLNGLGREQPPGFVESAQIGVKRGRRCRRGRQLGNWDWCWLSCCCCSCSRRCCWLLLLLCRMRNITSSRAIFQHHLFICGDSFSVLCVYQVFGV